jgi:hypothetical protein
MSSHLVDEVIQKHLLEVKVITPLDLILPLRSLVHTLKLRYFIIRSEVKQYVCPPSSSCLFSSVFRANISCAYLNSLMRSACSAQLTLLYLVTLIKFICQS